jgi:hypothetical protein
MATRYTLGLFAHDDVKRHIDITEVDVQKGLPLDFPLDKLVELVVTTFFQHDEAKTGKAVYRDHPDGTEFVVDCTTPGEEPDIEVIAFLNYDPEVDD